MATRLSESRRTGSLTSILAHAKGRVCVDLPWLVRQSWRRRGPSSASPLSPAVGEALEPRRLLAGIESGVLVARGTANADTISISRTGTDDVIVTTNGTNQQFDMDNFTGVRLEGLGGNDRIMVTDAITTGTLTRKVTVEGGTGNDSITGSSGADVLRGGDGNDTIVGLDGDDALFGQAGDDELSGRAGLNYVEGGDGHDTLIVGAESDDTLLGNGGDDTFVVENDAIAEDVNGGTGTDSIAFPLIDQETVHDLNDYTSVENASVRDEDKVLIGTAGPNRLESRGNANTVYGGDGNDTLTGGFENESLLGEGGNDSIAGGDGNDTLDGGTGTDTLNGGPGSDTLRNGEVTDEGAPPSIAIVNGILTATGTAADDEISIERTGTDDVIVRVGTLAKQYDMDNFTGVLLNGLGGQDQITILAPITAGSVTRKVTLEGGAGNDTLIGSDGDDVLRGGDGRDHLRAGAGADALFGQAGNDTLFGGTGRDFMDGGDNEDELNGLDHAGGDTLVGGNGADTAYRDSGDSVSSATVAW